ncbi:putative pectinesterase [Helianthus anomalus]
MDKLMFWLLILLISFQYTTCAITNPTSLDFIKTSCKTTRHPALCVNSLSNYASSIQGNDRQLAKAAIAVSLNNAKSAAAYVSKLAGTTSNIKPRESEALKDCVNSMTSCVASLTQSIQELGKMAQFKGQNFVWHMNNVQTWVSSALTNQNTCIGGFSDSSMKGQLKDVVNKKMSSVSQVTSNALALVNRFSMRHKEVTHNP